jgi:hypothetical protein
VDALTSNDGKLTALIKELEDHREQQAGQHKHTQYAVAVVLAVAVCGMGGIFAVLYWRYRCLSRSVREREMKEKPKKEEAFEMEEVKTTDLTSDA